VCWVCVFHLFVSFFRFQIIVQRKNDTVKQELLR
jgi:hypothetical protein